MAPASGGDVLLQKWICCTSPLPALLREAWISSGASPWYPVSPRASPLLLGANLTSSCSRVVDGIEDNGGTSEAQSFCFSTEPPPGAARDSPGAGTDPGSPALVVEAEQIKQNIGRLNQEINHLNREVSHLSRELQGMMELLKAHLGTPHSPACPCRLPAAVSPPAAPARPSPPVPPSSLSSPSDSPRAKRCPVRSRSAHAAATHPWLGAEGPRPLRGDSPAPGADPRRGSDSQPPPLPPRSARSFPGCSVGAWCRARPQPRSGSTSSQ
ncbi:potassium voltage-gated channel subfamily H member 4-like [Onychostruthus taczanowskii]|uniref:potassium voltage-gated channel subfamily H member 4-like n=1 Tax=Onychostruthus taczanowskii TaxID=356909 RepID=UPI001B804D0A|nr:potassium voltage-gated channel subfamily H member 4-like [Onychostruthus taczanowskii]